MHPARQGGGRGEGGGGGSSIRMLRYEVSNWAGLREIHTIRGLGFGRLRALWFGKLLKLHRTQVYPGVLMAFINFPTKPWTDWLDRLGFLIIDIIFRIIVRWLWRCLKILQTIVIIVPQISLLMDCTGMGWRVITRRNDQLWSFSDLRPGQASNWKNTRWSSSQHFSY